jgi:fructose-1,6-bisphosphatase/inositol monophosphatase family enzyme
MILRIQDKETLRKLLCNLELTILKAIMTARSEAQPSALSSVSKVTAADTIYAIDRIAEAAIEQWFEEKWHPDWPVEIVMEGLEDDTSLTFPRGTPLESTRLKCIIDPIDGTRGIMYDKRAAWILAGIAQQRGGANTLADIEVAVMTEIPTTRQWRTDQVSAIKGGGIHTTAFDVRAEYAPANVELIPSQEHTVNHAFGTISRFFPAGSALLSEVEERLWEALYGTPDSPSPVIFNDQYISSGGQLYEVLAGHDRFVADLRPEAFNKLGIADNNLTAHPYDIATALILTEAGCVVEKPNGEPLDYPLDTTTPVSWVAYANTELANNIRPTLLRVMAELL